MAPWRECDRCFIGPSVLYVDDEVDVSIGLFFIEIGIAFERKK
jgi:hypothetical protein